MENTVSPHKKRFLFIAVVTLLLIIPLTVFLLSKQQEIRQRASSQTPYSLSSAFFAPGAPFDYTTGYDKLAQVATVAWINRGWDDVANPSPDADVAAAKRHGMKIYLGFDPLCPDRKRVASLSEFATHNKDDCDATKTPTPLTHFQDADYKEAYINGVKTLASLYHPDYFLIGHEFNTYKNENRADYTFFVSNIYADAYQAIKTVSPQTQVAISFTYSPNIAYANNTALHDFVTDFTSAGNTLDMLPLSLYPQVFVVDHPENIPDDYFTQIMNASGTTIPLFISETGWFTYPFQGVPASNNGQAIYITKLKAMAEYAQAHGVTIAVINYVTLVDRSFCNYDDPAVVDQLNQNPAGWYCYLGLLNYQGLPKVPTNSSLQDAFTQMAAWNTQLQTSLDETPSPTDTTPNATDTPIPPTDTPVVTDTPPVSPSATISPTTSPLPTAVTPSPQITRTPTDTPIVTPVPVSQTPQPTAIPSTPPTSMPTTTKLSISLTLTGIADGSLANQVPLHPQRNVTVFIFNSSNDQVVQKTGLVTFSSSSKQFTGTIDLGAALPDAMYTVKVQADGYLRKLIPGIQHLSGTTPIQLPAVTLTSGDVNTDNVIDILDFNILRSCYGTNPLLSCSASDKQHTDFDDNGMVDGIDYNLFLRGMSSRIGD